MKKTLFLILSLFLSVQVFAQVELVDVTDSLLSSNYEENTLALSNVNVFKDPRLEALATRPEIIVKKDLKEKVVEQRKKELGVSNVTNYDPIKRGSKVVTGSIVNRKGFRIVIYSGSNRNEALEMKRRFMGSYGGTRSYMSYNAPNFKIRVGDFASKNDASKFLKRIQGSFPRSFIVPDIVTIKNINVR